MIRQIVRRSNTWVMLRRAGAEGFRKAYGRWRLWRQILRTAPIHTDLEGGTEVRLMCYFFDYLCAIWSLKSFYRAAGVRYPLTIHIQGNAPRRVRLVMQRHFPQARIVTQQGADGIVNRQLAARGWKRLLEARKQNQYLQKLTDTVLLSRFENIILLDSDVLFFRKPSELLDFAGDHIFQQDQSSNYLVQEAAGIAPAPRLNAGIMKFKPARISLSRCDEYLADFPTYQGWLEQTLLALHAAETGTADVLPPSYLISFDRAIDPGTLVARHYAGPTRALMTEEGMPWLIRQGFLNG